MAGSCCSGKPAQESAIDPVKTSVAPTTKIPPQSADEETVTKSKTQLKPGAAVQSFNGRTYACVACKNGHRVRTCTHGYDKPIAPTKQPGRPSSGSKRKCTCPKDCACHDKDNCKCDRNCVCVETMYLIVHVSKKDSTRMTASPSLPSRTTLDGRSEYLQEVLTDRSGNVLTDEEIKRRQDEQAKREQREQNHKNESKSARSSQSTPSLSSATYSHLPSQSVASPISDYSQDASDIRSRSTSVVFPTPSDLSSSSQGGCQHPTNIAHGPSSHGISTTQGCNCGATCQCIHCPEHANNAATRQYNHQQFAHMASHHDYLPPGSQLNGINAGRLFRPETPHASCMGGQATFRLSSQRPNPNDYEQLFPGLQAGEYVMQFPIQRTPQPHQQYQNIPNMSIDVHGNMQFEQDLDVDQNMTGVDMSHDFSISNPVSDWAIGEGDVDQVALPPLQPDAFFHQNVQFPSAIPSHTEYSSQAQPVQFNLPATEVFENITMPHFNAISTPTDLPDGPFNMRYVHPPLVSNSSNQPYSGEDDLFQEFTTIASTSFMGHPVSPIPKSSKVAHLVS